MEYFFMINRNSAILMITGAMIALSQSAFAGQICGEVMEYRGQRIIQPEERYWNYPTLIALTQDISKKLDGLVGKKACVSGDKVPVMSFYNEFSNTVEDPKEFIFVHTVKQ
jgi:hypothetical protein